MLLVRIVGGGRRVENLVMPAEPVIVASGCRPWGMLVSAGAFWGNALLILLGALAVRGGGTGRDLIVVPGPR